MQRRHPEVSLHSRRKYAFARRKHTRVEGFTCAGGCHELWLFRQLLHVSIGVAGGCQHHFLKISGRSLPGQVFLHVATVPQQRRSLEMKVINFDIVFY